MENETRPVAVDFIVGGALQGFAPASNADVVVVVDCYEELAAVPERPRQIKIPLGEQETARTLLERVYAGSATPEVAALVAEYQQAPNANLAVGMAQDPRIGACAVFDLALRGVLPAAFKQIYDNLLVAANGTLVQVTVRELNSLAGGMGTGGASIIGELFNQFLKSRTAPGTIIDHRVARIGALTFATLAPRGIDNTMKAVASNLNLILGNHKPANRLDAMEMFELPLRSEDGSAVGGNRGLRDLLAALLAQARYARSVQVELDRAQINHTPHNRLGALLRIKTRWSKSVEPQTLTAAAAAFYRDMLRELRVTPGDPDLSVAEAVRVEVTGIESAAQRANAVAAFEEMPAADNDNVATTIWMLTSANRAVALKEVLGGTPVRPKNVAEYRSVVCRYLGLIARLEAALTKARGELDTAEASRERFDKQLKDESRRARSWWRPLEYLLRSKKTIKQRGKQTAASYVDASTRRRESQARVSALAAAVTEKRQELSEYETLWTRRIEHVLERFAGGTTTVECKPLEQFYGKLLDAALSAAPDATGKVDTGAGTALDLLLNRSILTIPRSQVAELLGCSDDPDLIIAQLRGPGFAWSSPLWGGQTTLRKPLHRFIVLPPMPATELAALRTAAAQRKLEPEILAADGVAAGFGVVELSFYPVESELEARPPVYTEDSPAADAYVRLIEHFASFPSGASTNGAATAQAGGVA